VEIEVCGVRGEGESNIEESLRTLAEFRTHRKKFKWCVMLPPELFRPGCLTTWSLSLRYSGSFNIDIDTASGVSADTAGFDYHLCEIERMVESIADVDIAEAEIAAFADSLGLTADTSPVPGKIEVYLHQFKSTAHKVS
jgi:hypothetical protein